MNYSKVLAVGLAVLGLLSMAACKDPGDPNSGGQPTNVVIAIGDGKMLSKSTYGLWHASDAAPKGCSWNITNPKGKVIASGGKHDAIIAGSATRGGTLHTNCGKFHK